MASMSHYFQWEWSQVHFRNDGCPLFCQEMETYNPFENNWREMLFYKQPLTKCYCVLSPSENIGGWQTFWKMVVLDEILCSRTLFINFCPKRRVQLWRITAKRSLSLKKSWNVANTWDFSEFWLEVEVWLTCLMNAIKIIWVQEWSDSQCYIS